MDGDPKPISNRGDSATANAFGTFEGVFTPCVLTILGVIMFLRFGYVVGQAGVIATVGIVLASKLITVLTALSLSAIATNTRVEGGGAYFLISRSLGPEFGGAIGVVFFAAQALSVAMYVIGFTEALMPLLPAGINETLIATLTNAAVFACVMIGAGWTLRIQFFILAAVVLSLVSFFVGGAAQWDLSTLRSNLDSGYTDGENFWTLFALFFPAVTGIMAGANMSGELANPARSIPRGTLAAIVVTATVYLAMAVFIAAARPRDALIGNTLVIADIAIMATLITAGVFAATLSSAMGSMMGAPRIMQSLARDGLFGWLRPLAARSGRAAEPRRAILLTFAISEAGILLADLDSIAPLITMAFLVTYGLINLATFYEAITKNPSYRPKFRYCHPATSLVGALGCVAVMLLIDWRWAMVAVMLVAGLHAYLSRIELNTDWGHIQSGLLFERTRQNLMRLEDEMYHPKNWRPFVLALSGTGFSRLYLVVMGHWLTAQSGILTLGQIVPGELADRGGRRRAQEEILHAMIRQRGLSAFPSVIVAPDYISGVEALVQSQGLGRLRPNMVLLGCPLSADRMEVFAGLLRNLNGLGKSVMILRQSDADGAIETSTAQGPASKANSKTDQESGWQIPAGTIDVWWRGRANGELMVLLSHLILQHPDWRGRKMRLMRVVENAAGVAEVRGHLQDLLAGARINAEVRVVISASPILTIHDESRQAAITVLGFEIPEPGSEAEFFERIEHSAGPLSRVAFVHSAGEMNLE
ncbi:MAG: amino acid permease [Planctomycetota bacterium]